MTPELLETTDRSDVPPLLSTPEGDAPLPEEEPEPADRRRKKDFEPPDSGASGTTDHGPLDRTPGT